MFIVFEGLDGSGKSTHAKRLYDHFKSTDTNCLLTFEPTSSLLGSLARAATNGEISFEDDTLALLFAADRHEHFVKKISPVLADGGIVICDRYYYSNIVYQGLSKESYSRIMSYNQLVMKRPPDIVFFLDAEPQVCLERLKLTRNDISIYENLYYLDALNERYVTLFNQINDNVVTIKTSSHSTKDEVFEQILQAYNATITPPLLA